MMTGKPIQLTILALLAVCLASSSASGQANSFVLHAGRILPVAPDLPDEIVDGTIVVRDGRIVAIGRRDQVQAPPDLRQIEIPDGTVIPGLVAAASEMGGRHRGDESVAAGYRAVDQFDRFDDYAETLAAGVTTVHIDPGTHRLLTGQGAVVRLGGPPANRILRAEADLTVNLDPNVHHPPPDVTYPFPASADVAIPLPERQRPVSRLGQLLALNEAVRDALDGEDPDPYSIHRPALAGAWKDRLPLRIRADRVADLLAAIQWLERHKRSGYLVGGIEADRVLDAIGGANLPLVHRPRSAFRAPGSDLGTDPDAIQELDCTSVLSAGVKLAVAPPVGQPVADLRLAAIEALGGRADWKTVLQTITRVPAEILGVDDRVGSLAPGRDADLVVFSGDPLDVSSHVQRVYVQGFVAFQPPESGPLVIKAGMVWAGPDEWIADGQVLAENGKIVAVGRSVPHPPFARVIDARPGGFVTPGFIDAHSHLGLDGDRSDVTSDLRLSGLVGAADVTDARVAGAGITTVAMSPYGISSKGTTAAAVKTAGNQRDRRVIRDPAAVLLDVSKADPLAIPKLLESTLSAGQKYLDSWTKYEKDLKTFLEKKEKGETPELDAEADKKEEKEETQESKEPDPVTGTWEVKVTGVPTPEPITATIIVQLTDSTINGRMTRSSVGLTARLTGSFDGKHLSAEITPDMAIPGLEPPVKLEADLTGEDQMKGTITAMGITAQIEGTRVDKTAVELKVASRPRRGEDGRPLPPKVNEALEPIKALLEKKIPAMVRVSTSAQIREVLADLVEKRELPVTLLDAEGASAHSEKLVEKKVIVIVSPNVLRERMYRDYHQADDLSRAGVAIAFQSDAEDGARHLPAVVLYAVERGLDAQTALEALTVAAARALKIDDRVGTIEPGKDADLVIFSGHPFLDAGRVLRVIVDGKEVQP